MTARNSRPQLWLLLCLGVVFAWFSPWWAGGKNLAPLDLLHEMMQPWRGESVDGHAKNHIVSDAVDQYLVYRMVAAESYAKEGWLGWSSLTYGGTAQYANTMALYFDWTMQLHRLFDFWTAWHLGLMLQVMIAVSGMFFFLRGRSISLLWVCCGALAYGANSQFVTWIYHRWTMGAFCWVPWILFAVDLYRNGNRRAWGWVPLLIAMAFLGGTLQHAALVVLAVGAIWLEEALQVGKKPGDQTKLVGRYAGWGVLGAGLGAMMFIPCIDAFIISNRLGLHTGMVANSESSMYPHGILQPVYNLVAYPFQIFPSLLGRCDSVDVLKAAFKSQLLYVAYFGSLPVLVAFLSLWRKKVPTLARVLIAMGLLLPLTPLVRLLYQRLLLLFILGGIFAFVHFMENATRETRIRVFRWTAWLGGTAVAGWTALSIFLHLKSDILQGLREKMLVAGANSSFGYMRGWLEGRIDRFLSDLFIWSPEQVVPLVLLVIALLGFRWTGSSLKKRQKAGAIIVAVAVLAEVSLFASRWVVWSDPAEYALFPPTPETEALREHVGKDGRVSTLMHPVLHMPVTPFVSNTLSAYGIASATGYDSIVPDGMLLPNESVTDADKIGRLGVSHLITAPINADVGNGWKAVWESGSMVLYENQQAYPRLIGFRTIADRDEFFSGGDPEVVSLKESSGLENWREIELPEGVRWIRLAENQANGWEFRVGSSDEWAPVVRAPDASMLMEIPEDSSRVEMRYNPPARRMGFAVSAGSLVCLIGCSVMVGRVRRSAGGQAKHQ
ncbi:hypothetical protein [Haloferula sp.]|uniref:hypothetical protein n=1 Tax=Haloferula sp. TaxID=2497595 RepID=UPI00329E21E3